MTLHTPPPEGGTAKSRLNQPDVQSLPAAERLALVADVLSELGIKVANEPEIAQASLGGAGLGFIFAPKFHPTLTRLADTRGRLGIRTCLNILGLLANPAAPTRQVIGVWHKSLIEPVGRAHPRR